MDTTCDRSAHPVLENLYLVSTALHLHFCIARQDERFDQLLLAKNTSPADMIFHFPRWYPKNGCKVADSPLSFERFCAKKLA